jgi:alpha-1,2-mannosyltransferase
LAHGALPYRDFAFVHPPGIAVLMSPLAIFGDTRDAMAAARIVTALVVAANASLAAAAVRSFGRLAMLVAGLALAAFPLSVAADHTLTLEPYLVLFCLLGTVVMFDGRELASPRRIMLAGVLFGLAGAVKVWAVFPAAVALAVCVALWRKSVRPFGSGLLLGVGVPSLPFLLLAPGPFVHDVVAAQLNRSTTSEGFHAISDRLVLLLGLGTPLNVDKRVHLTAVIAVLLLLLVVEVYVTASRRSPVEWYVLGATALTLGADLFIVKDFYDYYSYFTVALAAMLLAVCVARLGSLAPRRFGLAGAAVLPAFVIAVAALAIRTETSYARFFLSGAIDPRATIAPRIPKGSCVVFDYGGMLIDSNRFYASRPGCPPLVDAFGLWLTDNHGVAPPAKPPYSEAFVATWRSWLDHADYAVLADQRSDYVPWTPELVSWFDANYRLVGSQPRVYVFRHVRAG